MSKIFIKSCHGSLEYDQARMFKDMGYEVGGNWDVGGTQRPKVPGVTDHNQSLDEYDVVLLHQTENFQHVMEDLLNQKKKVILNAFGQGCDDQHSHVSKLCQNHTNAHVSAYSVKDYNLYKRFGCPENKIHLMRFPKYLNDFKPWRNKWPICYISCNSIHRRGTGCGWNLLQQIESSGVPVILGGRETAENTSFGLGQTELVGMHNLFSNAYCHLHLGTVPAPITLTLIEAFCSGTPVVAYNNGSGLDQEGFNLKISNNVEELINNIKLLLNDEKERQKQHEMSLSNSKFFDVKTVAQQWRTLIERLV